MPEDIFGTKEIPEYILFVPQLKKKTPRMNRRPTISCVVATGI
jgi:hypothetical protein